MDSRGPHIGDADNRRPPLAACYFFPKTAAPGLRNNFTMAASEDACRLANESDAAETVVPLTW
jgi:hypothetical protein